MSRRWSGRALWTGLWALSATAEAAPEARAGAFPYAVTEQTLDNGLRVVVVPMGASGVVTFGTWMSVGSRDEVDAGRTGFAHFFEHLMFLGTPSLSADARERALLRMAADDNAWTWFDDTVYHVTLPASEVERLVAMEADRFQHLTLTPDDVRREAGAVYGEFRKSKASPVGQLGEALYATAFQDHTYGHDTIGYEADIADMPTAHAYAASFFDRFYRPEHATVLVVGDVEPDRVIGWVKDAYGTWTRGPAPRPVVPAEPPQQGVRRAEVAWPAPTAPLLAMGWRIPGSDVDSQEVAALELLGEWLLGDVGPLQQRLVRDEGLAFGVWGGRYDLVDPELFTVMVQLRPDADPAAAERAIREEVTRVVEGVDDAAFARLSSHVRYRVLSSLDDPLTVFETLGWALRRAGAADALDRWFATLGAVEAEGLSRAAARWLVDDGLSVVTLTHVPEEAP